jgi:hypothetical protein
MLTNFLLNAVLLVATFRAISGILDTLQMIHRQVLQWNAATLSLISQIVEEKHLLRRGSKLEDQTMEALRDKIESLSLLADAQRGLMLYLRATIDNGAGIRFLGVLRPGSASVGGFIAIAVSAIALGIRLASTVYGTSM